MKPAIFGNCGSIFRTVVAIDKLCSQLVTAIEYLATVQNPELAYLLAVPANIPCVRLVECGKDCGAFDLTYSNSGLSLIEDLRLPTIPSEKLTDWVEMRKLAYWISLLRLDRNMRVQDGNLEYRGMRVLEQLRLIVAGFIADDLRIVHKGVSE